MLAGPGRAGVRASERTRAGRPDAVARVRAHRHTRPAVVPQCLGADGEHRGDCAARSPLLGDRRPALPGGLRRPRGRGDRGDGVRVGNLAAQPDQRHPPFPSRRRCGGPTFVIRAYAVATALTALVATVFLFLDAATRRRGRHHRRLDRAGGLVRARAMCWTVFTLQDSVLAALPRSVWVPIENGLFGIAEDRGSPWPSRVWRCRTDSSRRGRFR